MQARQRGISQQGEGELAEATAVGGRGKMEEGRGKSTAGRMTEDLGRVRVEEMDGGGNRTAVEAEPRMAVVDTDRPS